jgi:glycosyltransferase involved in cell wall biosynthesis
VVSIHGALDAYLRKRGRLRKKLISFAWQREMLEHASAVHVTSASEAAAVTEVIRGLPLVTVPNGVDTTWFEQASSGTDFRERFLEGHQGPVVLFLGRIARKKALDVLVAAFALVRQEVPAARLAIVGPDDEGLLPSLELQARRLKAAEGITFVGPLYGPERLDALSAADAWVLPSHTENFGIAVIEAMAAGTPVIISPAVNLASEIDRAQAGLVVPRDSAALRDAMTRLLRDQSLRRALAYRGRELARRYDWSVVAPQLANSYRLAARRGSRYEPKEPTGLRRSRSSA